MKTPTGFSRRDFLKAGSFGLAGLAGAFGLRGLGATDDRRQTADDGHSNHSAVPLLPSSPAPLRIAVVGPCASGKSTLVAALKAAGYDARHPAQEHSYVPDMWQRLVDPDVLIYLDLSHAAYRARRPHDDAGPDYLDMQRARLAHARAHADLVIDTSGLTAEQAWGAVAAFLYEQGSAPIPDEPARPDGVV